MQKILDKDIIDAGGFIGDSALVFQDFTNKNIHSFEPSKSSFDLMLQTIQLNSSTRIIPINKGLGDRCYTTSINISKYISASSFKNQDSNIFEEAEIITLDSYVQQYDLRIGFIKSYVMGFEIEFLNGAKETICTQKPAILISVGYLFSVKLLLESWNLGYSFKIVKPIDFSISGSLALFCEVLDN